MADPVIRDPAISVLFRSTDLTFGSFDCEPDDPRWSGVNCAEEGHFVVFPGSAVRIAQEGRESVVADPHSVVFYNRGQTYRRSLVSPNGDHCVFVIVSPRLLAELARERFPQLRDPDDAPFSRSHSASAAAQYLLHGLLAARVHAHSAEPLRTEEDLIRLVELSLAGHFGEQLPGPPRRAGTRRAHAELVEDTKAAIAADIGEELTLDALAARVAASKYHLARVFRSGTGRSIHAYRDELRARLGVRAVTDDRQSLTTIALDLGYSSPSHFSDRFKRVFGAPPSTVRNWSRAAARPELSNILKGTTAAAL